MAPRTNPIRKYILTSKNVSCTWRKYQANQFHVAVRSPLNRKIYFTASKSDKPYIRPQVGSSVLPDLDIDEGIRLSDNRPVL